MLAINDQHDSREPELLREDCTAELREAERSLVACLASGIVHDLNNALSTMQTNTFLLRAASPTDREELLRELDGSIDEGIALAQQLRSMVSKPPPGPPARSVADLMSSLAVWSRNAFPQHVYATSFPDDAHDLWVGSLVAERVLHTCAVLLVSSLPPASATISFAASSQRSARADDATAQLRLQLRATHPVWRDNPSAVDQRSGWLSTAPSLRVARVLAQRQGGWLELRCTPDAALSFELALPLLDVEEARSAALGSQHRERPNDIS